MARVKKGLQVVWLALLMAPVTVPAVAVKAEALLLFESDRIASQLDCLGIAAALDEIGLPHQLQDLTQQPLSAGLLDTHAMVVACHLVLDNTTAQLLGDRVAAGAGLLATGASALGLESVLGLASAVAVSGDEYTEIRFVQSHPVATGSWWAGPITTTPPMPAEQVPVVLQYYYINADWPAYAAGVDTGTVVARWLDWLDEWEQPDGEAAVVVHHHGLGRTVYSAPLPGTYADGDWPHSWRTFIVSAVEWLAADQPLVELGYWPDAHRAAFSWTGDTERPAMVTVVPALLALFAELGLERFGTFYIVGRAGGDGDTLGAEEHPEVVAAIAAAGSEVGGHGDIHITFQSQDYDEQRQRLEEMQAIIDPMLAPWGERMRGFRAPYLSQGTDTWLALADLGFDYDAGEADVWSSTVLPHRVGGMWQLPPTMPMDWHLLELHAVEEAEVEAIFLDKLDYVINRRGLYSWLHHPWVIEDHLDMVRNVLLAAINRGDIWMARQDDILDWWIAREDIRIGPVEPLPGGVRIHVQNQGATTVAGVSIWIRAPAGAPHWGARINGVPVDLVDRIHAQGLFRVAVVPILAAGQTAVLEIVMHDGLFSDRFARVGARIQF